MSIAFNALTPHAHSTEHWKALNLYVPELNSIQDKGGGDADTLNGQNLMVIDDEQPPVSLVQLRIGYS